MCPAVKAVMEGEVGDSFFSFQHFSTWSAFWQKSQKRSSFLWPCRPALRAREPLGRPLNGKGEGEVCWEATGAENVWESSLDLINRNSRQPTEGYIERREFVSTKDLILGSLARKDKTLRSSSWRFQVEMIKTSSSHLDLARLECLWRDWEPCCVRNNSLNNS